MKTRISIEIQIPVSPATQLAFEMSDEISESMRKAIDEVEKIVIGALNKEAPQLNVSNFSHDWDDILTTTE